MHLLQQREGPTYDLTFQDVLDILQLIDSSPFAELQVELQDVKLKVSRHPGSPAAADQARDGATAAPAQRGVPTRVAEGTPQAAAPESAPAPASPGGQSAVELATGVAVKPPMAGTFYCAPAPGAPPYVEVGATVREGDTVGIVEVMKLFTPVVAPCSGTVRQILARNEEFVRSDRTLMVIEPAA